MWCCSIVKFLFVAFMTRVIKPVKVSKNLVPYGRLTLESSAENSLQGSFRKLNEEEFAQKKKKETATCLDKP